MIGFAAILGGSTKGGLIRTQAESFNEVMLKAVTEAGGAKNSDKGANSLENVLKHAINLNNIPGLGKVSL